MNDKKTQPLLIKQGNAPDILLVELFSYYGE